MKRPFSPPDFLQVKHAFYSLPTSVRCSSSGFCELSWFPPSIPLLRAACQIFLCISDLNVGSQGLVPRPAFLLFDVPSSSTISPMPKYPTISIYSDGPTFDLHPDLSSEPRPISPAASGQSPRMSHRHLQLSVSLIDLHPFLQLFFLQCPFPVNAHPSP